MSDLRTGKSDEKTEKSDLETALPQCHRPQPLRCGRFYQRMDGNGNFNGLVFATVSVPISAWWGSKHSIRKAKIQQQQAEND